MRTGFLAKWVADRPLSLYYHYLLFLTVNKILVWIVYINSLRQCEIFTIIYEPLPFIPHGTPCNPRFATFIWSWYVVQSMPCEVLVESSQSAENHCLVKMCVSTLYMELEDFAIYLLLKHIVILGNAHRLALQRKQRTSNKGMASRMSHTQQVWARNIYNSPERRFESHICHRVIVRTPVGHTHQIE